MEGSAHYEGRAIDVFVRPIGTENRKRGWAMAHYLVAQAERLGIDARHLRRPDLVAPAVAPRTAGATTPRQHEGQAGLTVAVLEHRDHVHVDVLD